MRLSCAADTHTFVPFVSFCKLTVLGTDRLTALCEQDTLTGIDFIQVVDPATQTLLRVFFVIDPDLVVPPWTIIPPLPAPQEAPFLADDIRIVSVSGGDSVAQVEVTAARFVRRTFAGQERVVLEIETAHPGDFSIYVLHIDSDRLDPFFNDVEFSFKQGCPSRFDCREKEPPCPDEALVDFPVDYLARDFTSLRLALLDFAAQRYPGWQERLEADAGVMLSEVMAALGDELSYLQDRYAREAHFQSATQRRSLRWHTSLVDYPIHDGLSATTLLAIEASVNGAFVAAGMRVWGRADDGSAIPFEIGNGLSRYAALLGAPSVECNTRASARRVKALPAHRQHGDLFAGPFSARGAAAESGGCGWKR
jgi:hypothetical protein